MIWSPDRSSPPARTTPITPALRTRLAPASCSSSAAFSPDCNPSSCPQGLRRPVISTTAVSPSRSRVPVGSSSRRRPSVVMFSPICPGETSNPFARNSACSSAWMRCTCRRFGCVGSRATRLRCLTVAPACASPSTPSPATRRMCSRPRFVNACVALQLTAITTPVTQSVTLPR
jgi:hypothetical protein